MNKVSKVHRSGALGAMLAGELPTLHNVKKQKEAIHLEKSSNVNNEQYAEIDPNAIRNWSLNDRPESELGDLETFAKELKEIGQQQPCIIRPIFDDKYQYEVIAGERRWRAAKLADIKLKVIIRQLDDHEAAIAQAAENANRKDLSDYAKGMSYAKLIEQDVLSQSELVSKLGITQSQVSRLLAFAKIPHEINQAIGDYSKVSARVAAEIRSLANKGEAYVKALIQLAPKIASGKLGGEKLVSIVEKLTAETLSQPIARTIKIQSKSGRHCFTWKIDSKNQFSISFSKDLNDVLAKSKTDIENQLIEICNQFVG